MTLFLTTTLNLANAALTATTANTIQGTKPYLKLSNGTKLTNLNQLLGFSMWDGTYNGDGSKHMIQKDASQAGTVISVPLGFSYNDVKTLITADGVSHSVAGATVGDDDGDASLSANTSVSGSMVATWKDGGVVVPSSHLGNGLTSCGGPYTFTSNNQGICHFRPASMHVYTGTAGYDIKYANGYNLTVWDSGGGFKVSSGFPTTGFKGAKFSVIGSGNDQSRYRCSSPNGAGKISLSGGASTALGSNCTVTYTAGTKAVFTSGGTQTIKMEYNTTGSTWVTIDSYSIPTPSKWALGDAGRRYYGNTGSLSASTNFPALDYCRTLIDGSATPATTNAQANDMTVSGKAWRQKYLYRRDELSISPYADRTAYPELSAPVFVTNYLSRDIGTFMGEWGYVDGVP